MSLVGIGFVGTVDDEKDEAQKSVFCDKYMDDVYNLAYDNQIHKYVYPNFADNSSSVANTKAIGKGDEYSDEDGNQAKSSRKVLRYSKELEDAVSLESLGVSKCGYHLDD